MAIKYESAPIFAQEPDGSIPIKVIKTEKSIILTKGLHRAIVDIDEAVMDNVIAAAWELSARTDVIYLK